MILYIITDSYEKYRNGFWLKGRNVLEETARDSCLSIHYTQVTLDMLHSLRPWAICHSGGSTPYQEYDVLTHRGYRRMATDWDGPQFGICRGHQVVAHFFGSRIGPMRRLRSDEPDPASYHPGWFKEWGVYPVHILRTDALFKGCGRIIRVPEAHFLEVKKLGAELILLARSQDCGVQAFRHRHKPVYGVQFHPEQELEHYPDGKKVLENFFRIAGSKRLFERKECMS